MADLKTATNPKTGERVYLDAASGSWLPLKTATNPETGEKLYRQGDKWLPLTTAAKPEPPPVAPPVTPVAAPAVPGMARPDASYAPGQVPVASPEEAKANQLLTERANFKSVPNPSSHGFAGMSAPPETFNSEVVQSSADLPADAKNANILWALQQGADQGQVRPPDAVEGSPSTMPRPTGSGPWVLNPQTGQYISRDDIKANINPDQADAAKLGAFNSLTFGAADNLVGAVDPYTGEVMKALREKTQEDFPGTSMTGDVVGAIASPITVANRAKNLWGAVKNGASTGAIWGALYGFNNADDQRQSRAKDGLVGGLLGGVLGGVAPVVLTGIARTMRPAFDRLSRKVTVENAKNLRDSLYAVVDRDGTAFGSSSIREVLSGMTSALDDVGLKLSQVKPSVLREVSALKRLVSDGKTLTLSRLDKIRSELQDFRFNPTTTAQEFQDVGKLVTSLDAVVDKALDGSPVLRAAREAHKVVLQVQTIADAMRRAELNAASAGAGGNIANTTKQALKNILLNERASGLFKQETLDLMESVVLGNAGQDIIRRIGKLSPGGNGLMLSLGLLQAQLNPAMAGISALGGVAKGIADRTVQRGARDVFESASGASLPRATVTGNAAPLIAPAINALRGYGQGGQQ